MTKLQSVPFRSLPQNSTLAVFAFEKSRRPAGRFPFGPFAERALGEAAAEGFAGKSGQTVVVHPREKQVARLIATGLGAEAELSLETVRRAASAAARRANAMGLKSLYLRLPDVDGPEATAQAAAEGVLLGLYSYQGFKSKAEAPALQTVSLIARDAEEQKKFAEGLRRGRVFGESVNFARDLINRPPSDATPDYLVGQAKKLTGGSVRLKIFNKAQLERMGMGAVLGVNRGSSQPPYFLHFVYRPAGKPKRRIAVCGKGITFDSGGLSLKPAASMETMKYDMSGAATVLALIRALRELRPNVEVHGLTPMTENMPGGRALKPGDVLRTLRGRTIEVLNTDAEGRLILADALSYACRQPVDEIIDIATLTGACVIALGTGIAGLMGNDRALIDRLKKITAVSGEKLWELPLDKDYEPLLRSQVADIKNIGPAGQAGTILAGLFLKSFVDEGKPWAHLDIASTGWTSAQTPLSDVGATGVMIRTLLHHILSYR